MTKAEAKVILHRAQMRYGGQFNEVADLLEQYYFAAITNRATVMAQQRAYNAFIEKMERRFHTLQKWVKKKFRSRP